MPLALVAGMFLGRLMDGIDWISLTWRAAAALVVGPVWLALVVWIIWLAARGEIGSLAIWLAVLILLPLAKLLRTRFGKKAAA